MKRISSILIVNTFGIGDVLFSTPLVRALHDHLPGADIHYISNSRAEAVLKENPFLKSVIIFEKDDFRKLAKASKTLFLKEFLHFFLKIKSLKADLMVDLSLNYQASLMGKCLGIKKRIGFNYRDRGKFLTDKIALNGFDDKHVVLYYLEILRQLDININADIRTETFTAEEDDKWADDFLEKNGLNKRRDPLLGIFPGGGKSWGDEARYRRWPVSNFAHVADMLMDDFGVSVILFGDKNEEPLCDNVMSFMRNKPLNLSGKTTVSQFMSLVKKCDLVLCNEGGPLHIAVAIGTPTVSIFGPVDEKIYGPYCDKNGLAHKVVSDRTKCKPCYSKFKHKKCDNLICLNSISEDRVYNTVKALMEETTKIKVK